MTARSPIGPWLLRALAAAVLVAGAALVASCTEWTEVEVPTAAKGEALKNPLYAAQRLAESLGATTAQPTGLSQLPPTGGTLWLASWEFDLFPENAARLRSWVEAGGHLVMSAAMVERDTLDWVPVMDASRREADDEDEDEDEDEGTDAPTEQGADEDGTASAAPPPPRVKRGEKPPCRLLVEPPEVTPAFGDRRGYRFCGEVYRSGRLAARADTAVRWSVGAPRAASDILRVPVGRGSVTVVDPWGDFDNDRLFEGDHPALLAATLQLRRGATVWFVREESRTPFVVWLWQQAPVAWAAAFLALALALWRGAPRFGPGLAVHAPARRSMAEQVQGTAQFLRHRGATALHAAQLRALEDTSRTLLPRHDKLHRGERAALLARVTGLDAAALNRAFDRSLARSPAAMAATLELLETARRRLRDAARDRTLARRLAATAAAASSDARADAPPPSP